MTVDWPYTSHMVLQRNKDVVISGTSEGDSITFDFLDVHKQVPCVQGHWSVSLYLKKTGGPYIMTVQDTYDSITLGDIYVGDVFLAAGQSNMEMKVHEAKHGAFDVKRNVRFLHVPQYIYQKDEGYHPAFKQLDWQCLNKDNFEELSAVAYEFIRNLDVNVPIGIIDNNRGGTSASCWISEDYLRKDPDLYKAYVLDYYKDIHEPLEEQLKAATLYYKKLYDYVAMFDTYRLNHPEMSRSEMKEHVGHTPWPPPKGHYDFRRPCGLYYTMFLRTAHYPIKAVLWYQGEEDSLKPQMYEQLLTLMIRNWRDAYHDHVPFFIIQLPKYESDDYQFSKIRLIQNDISQQKDNYLITSLDSGEADNIHPTDKSVIGKRLADSVSHFLYHKDNPVLPLLTGYDYRDQQLVIAYDQPLERISFKLMIDRFSFKAYTKDHTIICPIDKKIYDQTKHISYGDQNILDNIVRGINHIPISPFQLNINNSLRH